MSGNTMSTLGETPVFTIEVRGATANDQGALLTADEICSILKIKKSFLYAPCRRKGPDAIPCIMVGKYIRYHLPTVRAYFEKQNQNQI
jgi:hypothetical protein